MIYDVTWHIVGQERDYLQRVNVIAGYTTVADVPKIIAVARTGDASNSVCIRVDSATVCLSKR